MVSTKKNVKANVEQKRDKLQTIRKKRRNQILKDAILNEDKVIKQLEKKLKLNKRKKKTIPKSFVEDGLDYLLDFCMEKDRKYMVETEKGFINEELDTIAAETLLGSASEYKPIGGKKQPSKSDSESKDENEDTDEDKHENDESMDRQMDKGSRNDSKLGKMLNTKVHKTTEVKAAQSKKSDDVVLDNEGLWEDIYGRKRDAGGNIVPRSNEKYIPPAARVCASNEDVENEKLVSLKKQLKGYLNRVTEQNIHYITNQIEALYMTNSRNHMNYVFSELILESLISPVITPDRLIREHMMLIAILHANIGIEVGAHFLEKLVKMVISKMGKAYDVENKELDNMILMISHLYNFKVFGHKILYQILHRLMGKFTEKEIELILLLLKTVGFTLRKDDPHALKEFIQILQVKARNENENNSRVKYMLDILLAIKNNNLNKIPQCDPSHVEHLRKIMKTVIRKGNMITQFNVSLEDLLHADEIGKWWIVGSAWSGSNMMNNRTSPKEQNKLNFDNKILELAQKQRMNTDTRRNIFCVLMTAEDYLDAFEKLHHLGLKDQQEGEIVHVLMHCCLRESKFNLYYAVLAKRLCEYNRKYQLTIQYALWDKLKTLGTYGSKQLNNLAQFLTYLLIEKTLALSIFKIIQFTEMDKHTMKFLRQILIGILLHENEHACLQVFERISTSPQLHTLRESLRLFINCFIVKNADSCNIVGEQKVTLRRRAESVDKALISHGAKFVF